VTTKLAHQTQKTAGIPNGLRAATVSAVGPNGITLSISGADVGPFACLDTMLPVVGDVVSVFRQDSSWVILGRPTLNPSPWFFSPLLNGWTGTLAVRLVRGAGLSMQIAAQMTPGTKTDNTTIAQLPAPYIPKTTCDIVSSAGATVAGGQVPHFAFRNTGVVSCQGYTASASAGIQAILPLDF
jgi:hypothetical protein